MASGARPHRDQSPREGWVVRAMVSLVLGALTAPWAVSWPITAHSLMAVTFPWCTAHVPVIAQLHQIMGKIWKLAILQFSWLTTLLYIQSSDRIYLYRNSHSFHQSKKRSTENREAQSQYHVSSVTTNINCKKHKITRLIMISYVKCPIHLWRVDPISWCWYIGLWWRLG